MSVIEPVLIWLFTRASGGTSMLVALAQVNTGFFGVSITLLTILPSLIELVRDKSANFVEKSKQLEQLDTSLQLFRYATLALGLSALLSATLTVHPARIGILVSLAMTIIGSLCLAIGSYQIADITRQSLAKEK